MNFATIFAGNANDENNYMYAIGFAVACQEHWRNVGRLIPTGISNDAVHNRGNGYMCTSFLSIIFYLQAIPNLGKS